ncbi:uncharacterized protein [Diadema setosum]|uniref:uncharacterized protein n=1 Tax=Diadema setosum TaxID=31175 RepID=UPI003B3B30A3
MGVIGVCSSGPESSIKRLLHELRDISSRSGDEVRFIQLPYNDLDSFKLPRDTVDGIILCHSIHNRRFSITDVDDALYDKFLPRMAETFGRENVAVIAHDFPWPSNENLHTQVQDARMASFRIKQPTTFKSSALVLTSGRMDTILQMDVGDLEKLERFATNLRMATTHFKVTELPGIMYESAWNLSQRMIEILLIILLVLGPSLRQGIFFLFAKVAISLMLVNTKLKDVSSTIMELSMQHWSQTDNNFLKTACHDMKNSASRMCVSIQSYSKALANGIWCLLPVSLVHSGTKGRVSYLFGFLPPYTHVKDYVKDCAGWLYGMIKSLSIPKEWVQNSCNAVYTIYIGSNEFVWMTYSMIPSHVTVKECFRSYLSFTAWEIQRGNGSSLLTSVTIATGWLKTKLQTCLYLSLWLACLPFLIPWYVAAAWYSALPL